MRRQSYLPLPSWSTSLRELDEARREIARLFGPWSAEAGFPSAGVFPAINVSEDTETIYVRAELPGIKAEDLDIAIEKNSLTISGERHARQEDDSVSFHRREREWGAFRRCLTLPVPVEADKVQARYSDGILTVILPKAAEARPRQITVQAQA